MNFRTKKMEMLNPSVLKIGKAYFELFSRLHRDEIGFRKSNCWRVFCFAPHWQEAVEEDNKVRQRSS